MITADEWARQPPTQGGVLYTLWSVKRVGPFVLVGVGTSERIARNPADSPQLYAAGVQYYLMQHNGEWVVVLANEWVT